MPDRVIGEQHVVVIGAMNDGSAWSSGAGELSARTTAGIFNPAACRAVANWTDSWRRASAWPMSLPGRVVVVSVPRYGWLPVRFRRPCLGSGRPLPLRR